jgi:hypothetical protein
LAVAALLALRRRCQPGTSHWAARGHRVKVKIHKITPLHQAVEGTWMAPTLSERDVAARRDRGELVLVLRGSVYSVGPEFLHPGGTQVRSVQRRRSAEKRAWIAAATDHRGAPRFKTVLCSC